MSEAIVEGDDSIDVLESWLKTKQNLPVIEKEFLKTFLAVNNGNLEKAKKLIEINYQLRNDYPQIFINRDPNCDETKKQLETEATLVLPDKTPNGDKVVIYKLETYDPSKHNFTESIKIHIMLIDVRCILPDATGAGEIAIFDMTGYTLKHLAGSSLFTVRIFLKFLQDAITVNIKEIHIINCPSYVDKVMSVIRPFTRSELLKLIKFHRPQSETLFEYIPKDIFPIEYGGKAGKSEEIRLKWREILHQHREYLTNQKYWKNPESKFKKKIDADQQQGSFQNLNVD